MNLRQLNEVTIANGDSMDKTFDYIGQKAKAAFGKFKAAHAAAKSKAQADQAEKDKADKSKADAEAAAAAADSRTKLSFKASPQTAPITIASIIVKRDPTTKNVTELDDLDAEHFNNVLNAYALVTKRFQKFKAELPKKLRTWDRVQGDIDSIEARLEGANEKPTVVASVKVAMAKNWYGEQQAMMYALTNDDIDLVFRDLKRMIITNHEANDEENKSTSGNFSQRGKDKATGMLLINKVGVMIHIIEGRLKAFKDVLDQVSQKAVVPEKQLSEDLLKRAGKLAKRL